VHTTNLRKVGGSVMLSVPPAILDLLHLEAGSTVGLAVEGDRLVIATRVKPHYTLDELLAQCDAQAPLSDEDREWIELPSVGREL
jgi:antitoxin ChpS